MPTYVVLKQSPSVDTKFTDVGRVEAPSRGRAHEKFTAASGPGKYVLVLFSAFKRDLAR